MLLELNLRYMDPEFIIQCPTEKRDDTSQHALVSPSRRDGTNLEKLLLVKSARHHGQIASTYFLLLTNRGKVRLC